MKRTGPEDSRSRAEALYQLGVAQAYAGDMLEPIVPLGNTLAVPGKRKKNLEKLGSSHGIDLGVVDLDGLVKDIRDSDQCQGGASSGKNQVQRMEATGQGESGSKDSQAKFLHIRAPDQPHTKGL